MHGFVSLLSAGSEPAECISVQANEVFQKREHWKVKWRDAEWLCESQPVLGKDGTQIQLHPKQLHAMLLTCLCIILPIQAFPFPGAAGPSLPPPITPGEKSRLLEASPQAATLPERQNRLLGFFCGTKLIFFLLVLSGPAVFANSISWENLRLTLAWSSKILTSPLKTQNHPSLWMQEKIYQWTTTIKKPHTTTQRKKTIERNQIKSYFFLVFSNVFSSVKN